MKYALTTQRKNNVFPSLFDDFITRGLFEGGGHDFADRAALPSVNIKEDEQSFALELLVPGWEKKDFDIQLKDNVLTVSAEHVSQEEGGGQYSLKEFNRASFTRRFNLPDDRIDNDKISATYEAGVLRMALPKRPEEVIKEIAKSIKIS